MPSRIAMPGELDILSSWKCICDSWDTVTKLWELSLHNRSGKPVKIDTPLTYPIQYPNAELLDCSANIIEAGVQSPISGVEIYIRHIGNPVHNKAVVLSIPKSLDMPPDAIVNVHIEFRHGGYFRRVVANHWVHTGVMAYLKYPPFKELSVVQRVYKEYHIANELTLYDGRRLTINPSPACDGTDQLAQYLVVGYGRYFEVDNDLLRIDILIKD